MILDTFLIHIRLQWCVGGLPRHGADSGHADPAPAVLHSALAAAGELFHGIPDHPGSLAGLVDLI